MIPRNAGLLVDAALGDTPVVFLNGPRRSGKSTFAQALAGPGAYYTLDDEGVRSAARQDPEGFVRRLPRGAVIDEVQRLPEMFLALKAAVDRDYGPGRFILTGSANLLLLPQVSDALAGRIQIVRLWPFSQGEIEGVREGFVAAAFGDADPALDPSVDTRDRYLARAMAGGFPEAIDRANHARRGDWFESYVTTLVQRDVRDLAAVEGASTIERLVRLLASRSPGLLNHTDISRTFGLPVTTLRRYIALLRGVFLVDELLPWAANTGKRLTRASKLYFRDSGLLAHLAGLHPERAAFDPAVAGPVMETFVFNELERQLAWSPERCSLLFFRTHAGLEVDFVLEARDRRLVGVEVKATTTVTAADFRGLREFAGIAGPAFHRGILLYAGEHTLPFGPGMWAMPLSALWRWGAEPGGLGSVPLA